MPSFVAVSPARIAVALIETPHGVAATSDVPLLLVTSTSLMPVGTLRGCSCEDHLPKALRKELPSPVFERRFVSYLGGNDRRLDFVEIRKILVEIRFALRRDRTLVWLLAVS